jgi:hypothetical protein
MKARNIFIVAILFFFVSCEKVVYIDLNTTNPKLIVEANVTNQPGPYTVLLSHSVNYYDPNIFPAVTGASVIISDDDGNTETLTEVSPGKYQTSSIQGVEGRTYSLKIIADGNEYDAASTMPYRVAIDSVNFEQRDEGNGYRVICKFIDPEGMANYYKLQLSSNDTANLDSTDVRILADGFADGQELTIRYGTHLVVGDTVTVKLECIDKVTYDFYRTLPNVEGDIRQFMSAPPANPVTNLSNGALGYFAACAVSKVDTIVH